MTKITEDIIKDKKDKKNKKDKTYKKRKRELSTPGLEPNNDPVCIQPKC